MASLLYYLHVLAQVIAAVIHGEPPLSRVRGRAVTDTRAIVQRMNADYDREHLERLLPQLRTANAKQAQRVWKEAAQLGVSEELERIYRMGNVR